MRATWKSRLAAGALVLVAGGLSSCVTTPDAPDELSKTFDKGYMTIPAYASSKGVQCQSPMTGVPYACLNKIDASQKYPVVVYMHGCAGLDQRNLGPFERIVVTVAPDSFARTGRGKDCGVGSDKKHIMEMRFAEVRHTYEMLIKLPWVDPDRIVLAGFSEGGLTAALYPGDEFAGRIILGWVCASADQWYDGINGSTETPVLAVAGLRDRYHQSASKYGRQCGDHFRGRPKSESILIPEGTHNIVNLPETRDAIKSFLEDTVGLES